MVLSHVFALFVLGVATFWPVAAMAAEPILIAKPDAFKTLVNPDCSHCVDEARRRAGELRDTDRVLAWTRGKYQGGAIPYRFFLAPYRVISDTYGVFVYDPDAGFARGFEPSLDFTFHGWRNGVLVMQHKDGTLYSTLSGKAFAGPRQGDQLKPIATLVTHWGPWNAAYANTVAYKMYEKYQPLDLSTGPNSDSVASRIPADPRLPKRTEVIGVTRGDAARAYPLKALQQAGGILHDSFGGLNVAVLYQSKTNTAAIYSTGIEGTDPAQSVELAADAQDDLAPYVDRKTGSRFDMAGRGISGSLKGKTLRWVPSVQCYWFAWAAEYPRTEIRDRAPTTEKPKSGAGDKKTNRALLIEPQDVTPQQVARWKEGGHRAVVLLLDERFPRNTYENAARDAASAALDVYYWIEIARTPKLADAYPRWMAGIGMHGDWRKRWPKVAMPREGEVVKAYPWVPLGYREAFEAHRTRVEKLLHSVPAGYRGVLLNDLQGGPSSCGCGNGQCRWAYDYHVASTATLDSPDDAATRFVEQVSERFPHKEIVPVWTTECEEVDLSAVRRNGAATTGLCGDVPCAHGACPREFTKQWLALDKGHRGPLGLLLLHREFHRVQPLYGDATAWISQGMAYADQVPPRNAGRAVPHDRLWLVVQGYGVEPAEAAAAQAAAEQLHPSWVLTAGTRIDQSWEPRIVSAK